MTIVLWKFLQIGYLYKGQATRDEGRGVKQFCSYEVLQL